MKKDAEIHAAEDKKKQEAIETKNLADAMVYTAEKTLKENEKKEAEPAFAKSFGEAREKIAELKKVKDSDNVEDVKAKTKDLSEHMQKIGAELYKQQPQGGPASAPGSGEAKDKPKAEEGEFKEK